LKVDFKGGRVISDGGFGVHNRRQFGVMLSWFALLQVQTGWALRSKNVPQMSRRGKKDIQWCRF
jgi:hypothetical protein